MPSLRGRHSESSRGARNMAPIAALFILLSVARAEILTPPYFNLALGKKITATATCGDEGLELYCKLAAGANADQEEHVISGQVCDECDARDPAKRHPPEYAVDGMETWWQSPPLSRGMKYNEVNLTIDLGQEFHVAYVFVRMGNSPRPGLWALEKSTDYGKTFKPWQYFSDSSQDCERYFGKESLLPISRDDSVICSTEYSKIVPLEGGEIPISLLNYRPSANKYFNSSVLQEWTRATNVRLRLLRTKNLYGHLMSVARQDHTVTRRYFYSIKDISIGGRCMCNGHADNCDPSPVSDSNILVCRCQHNTCGPQCNMCCPGFEQKKWRISQHWDRFSCEPCNCYNHSTECEYDPDVDEKRLSLDIKGRYEGGGVCKNCQHNTMGINCNKCQSTYYRPYGKSWGEIDVCKPCECDLHYSTGNCEEETGRCECRKEYNPPDCDSCAYGYFDYPNCKPCICNMNGTDGEHCTPVDGLCPCKFNYAGKSCEICGDGYYSPECKNCECNLVGSVSQVCDKDTGNCTCKSKYAGRTCNQCEAGYYNYPTCKHCTCDVSGTKDSICDDVDGTCICKDGFGGARCDQCTAGYYMEVRGRERSCVKCNCSSLGSTSTSCSADGKCNCLINFGGKQCEKCSPGYYKYPECLACNCDVSGSLGSTCDDKGLCHCKPNFDGNKCEQCREHFYNYPVCEECNCDPRGVIATFAGCGSVPAGELCQCKDRVQGRICNDCKPLYWNLQEYNPLGCEECRCNVNGTIGRLGTCNTRSGQCTCKTHIGGPQCDQCGDGFYQMEADNLFGCTECDCDIGGTLDNIPCDKSTGQCPCHSRVDGRRCDRPIRAHYFPTLHQFQYEVEEGLTRSGAVRYRSAEDQFPGYSWKGYVIFSVVQNEVINVVHIDKSSLYRMVVRYASEVQDPVLATVVITPESVLDIQQSFTVLLKKSKPTFVTVAGEKGTVPSPLIMSAGNWTVTIKTNKEVMIDYFVLIPAAYYEATVLTKPVDRACVIGDRQLCRHSAYPSLNAHYIADNNNLANKLNSYVDNPQQLQELNVGSYDIPIIEGEETAEYNLQIDAPGQYVLLLEYVTPVNRSDPNEIKTGILNATFQSGNNIEIKSDVQLNNCPYTSPCRQVLIDDFGKVLVVSVKDAENIVTLKGISNTLVGIKSVVAIPESEWHIDYITPRPFCIRRNGKCDRADFPALDAKKMEVETGTGGDHETKPQVADNTTELVYISAGVESLRIDGKVSTPGYYFLVLHYYQPDHSASKLQAQVSVDGQQWESTVDLDHCPSISGCRALLERPGDIIYPLVDNFTIVFKSDTSKGVWLDYVLAIAKDDFMDSALTDTNRVDYTREFLDKCTKNHYYVNTSDTGFCRDAVFSITAEYNSGTLGCVCDVVGSTDLECEPFGGQCRCRDNVIGRTCSSCRTGYYGFPDCKPCHCPKTAICNDDGACICPKNVMGENCTTCKPFTFNYDELRGCDDCSCNPLGVRGGNLACDMSTGNCDCKPNVIGRMCDHCEPGHFAFPHCERCSCDLYGTMEDVCDQNTAQCFCKKHVRGAACDTCKEEYFNLQPDNPDGCTRCHCFGKTSRCTSSDLYWVQIVGMRDWQLANIEVNRTLSIYPNTLLPVQQNNSVISADIGDSDTQKILYFVAPHYYIGKRLASYGGYLSYSIYYTARFDGHAIAAPDVIIAGANNYIVHNSIEQPPALTNWLHSVRISEEDFTHMDGSPITRDQFMHTLNNITAIYIRAAYEEEAVGVRLMLVALDVADEDPQLADFPRRAASVEACQCPPAYRGLSCEQCAAGYYRLSSGPHAGFCVPCQCNSHTNECDVNTGICLECMDNTMGDHCEQCIPGYHGDATIGTPHDCLICACPMPYTSNNFAIGCELSENGTLISCDCKDGYIGPRCEFCATGYYGQPEVPHDYCKPCKCSGNINVEDPGACDSVNGDCLKCQHNTAGTACNLCAPGFYGDAILSKNCTACICDEFGMDHCDPTTGTCVCRPGVIGAKCDRCAPDHWGLNSGQGCTPCDCGLASNSTQCDDNTGHCSCAKGVTGRHCDQCAAGYWNYSKDGCDHCNCNTGYSVGFMCNAYGQCECLPGVVGEKCDRCPDRWVLIPEQGCLECDSCTDALIFTVEDLSNLLANETQDFKDKADTFFTTQRLNYISNQTEVLRPRVAEMSDVALNSISTAVKSLESDTKNLLRSAEFAATDSDKQIDRAARLTQRADDVLASVREHAQDSKEVVSHVTSLATSLELSQQPKVDSAQLEAQQIFNDIQAKDLSPKKELAENAYLNATAQIERMNIFVQPVNDQAKRFEIQVNATRDLKDKLEELLEYTDLAQQTASKAEKFNQINKLSKVGNKVLSVTLLNNEAMQDLIDAASDIANATAKHHLTNDVVANAKEALDANSQTNKDMEDRLAELILSLPDLRNSTNVAEDHARRLTNRADNLRAVAERENNNTRTQHAYSAASAYSSIVQEIGDGKRAADEATEAIKNATEINELLKQRVLPTHENSGTLAQRASEALATVQGPLKHNLTRATRGLQDAKDTLSAADNQDKVIIVTLPKLNSMTLSDEIEKATRVVNTVKDTQDIMSALGNDLTAGKDWAQSLPKRADDAIKMTNNVDSLLNDINEMSPNITSTYRSVEMRQSDLDAQAREADARLKKLKELIEQARTVANRIPVGVSFDRRSTLQPRLPDSVDEMSTSTRVSAYFRTAEPNGLLLYLGNPKGTMLRRTKSDDFMVVGVQNGYPYLVMDIGDSAESGREPARITSDKYVSDNKWYQIIVDRVGRNVKLSIRETLDNNSEHTTSKEAVLPGQHTIFNLDKQKSKLYVGGVPSDAKLQGISFPAFEGQIEELMLGDSPVGLWNFATAENLNGARQRDKLLTAVSGPQEYRFNGRAHVTMPGRRYLERQKNQVLLFFRTYASSGLIYLVGDATHFFSIQMQDGKVYLQVSLGNPDDLTIIGTTKSYNDGRWHKLDAGRYHAKCSLKVDNEVLTSESSSADTEIVEVETMNFGGNNKGIVQVTSRGYDGCLRQISIDGININLSESVESIGVTDGCQFASLVSLSGADSYLRYSDVTTENLQLTLKFRSGASDGLLFLYVSRTQTATNTDTISLSLVKGKLVLMSQREQLDTSLHTYNDSQWHVVTVTHNAQALKLVVDDFDHFSTDTAPDPLHILEGVLFVGGIQPGYVVTGRIAFKSSFQGCIADATINGRVLNLLEPFSYDGVLSFGRCGDTTSTGGALPGSNEWAPQSSTSSDTKPLPLPPLTTQPEISTTTAPLTTEAYRPSHELLPTVAPLPTPAPFPPTTTRRPQPSGCALAHDPNYEIGDPEEGYRFGTSYYSHIKYSKLPGRQLDGFDLTVAFRTFDANGGLIFYATASADPNQFLAIYMKDGQLRLAYNCGGETALVTSTEKYNDMTWHTLTVVRNREHGKLSVSTEHVAEGSVQCNSPAMLTAPFYYGGMDNINANIKAQLDNFYQPFMGCLKGLQMNGQYVTEVQQRVNSLRCTDAIEHGYYFGPSNGAKTNYLKLLDKYIVGREISIKIDVKPRNSTGLLFSVQGRRDYLVLEMLDEEVRVTVENGKGAFYASFKLSDKYSLCDGQWHTVHAVKSGHVVSVGVDDHFSDPASGKSGMTNTGSAIYIGGHERRLSTVKGVTVRRGFTGCMRNIVIMNNNMTVPITAAQRNTHVGACPID